VTAIKSHQSRVFEQLVAAHRFKLMEAMAAGVPHETYTSLVGEVRGLDAALKLSEQADYQLSGEEPDADS
jgi:hypothetical protein